jgi:TonB-linked SusC/RagA family outer membrane protein
MNLYVEKSDLKEVIMEIKNQTGFDFLYNKEIEPLFNGGITVKVEDGTIEEALNQLFKDSNIQYQIVNKTIILTPLLSPKDDSKGIKQQNSIVSGIITDEKGEPLIGASIVVKGTTSGVISDMDGKYAIPIPGNEAVLIYSYVGFITHDVLVGNKREINVTLSENSQLIDEVVVIGYGTASKKRLTTSVGSLKTESIQEFPITNIGDAFAGQISGITAENGTGAPGASPVIRIRGYGSINAGSEPLYVIDGVMASSSQFSALNPKSIETIDVLKDAAAGAIYGSRAGNGVILVTTKKGKSGEARFAVNTTFGIQQLERKVDVLNTRDWLSMVEESYLNDGMEAPEFYSRPLSSYANTDWQDEIYRNSTYQNYQISASGGDERLKYYVDANVLDNEGIMITTYAKTYSSTGSFDMALKPNLKMGLTYSASHKRERINNSINAGAGHQTGGYGISGGIIQQSLWMPPVMPVYEANGDYGQIWQKEFGRYNYLNFGFANPVASLRETHDEYSWNKILARGYITYEPIDGLALNASLSVISDSFRREYYVSPYLAGGGGSTLANFSNPAYDKMIAGQENGMSSSWTSEFYANYKKIFGDHSIDATLGYSAQYFGIKNTTARSSYNDRGSTNAENPIPAFSNYFQPNIYGAALVLGGNSYQENTFASVFGRMTYSYKDRYILMGSVRRDGSSKFAPDQRYGYFPAISLAWRLSEEDFIKKIAWIDDLKIRTSFGVSGNDQFGNYAWQGTVRYSDLYTYGPVESGSSGTGKALIPSTIENNKLRWETNEQTNIGVDVGIVGNRINLTADYFIRKTKNMLLYRSLPSENGIATSIFDNIGNMSNKGLELSLHTVNIQTKDFSWATNFTFTKINNKVDKVFTSSGYIPYNANNFLTSSGFESAIRIVEGEPMFQIYSYKVIGTFETEDQLSAMANPGGNSVIGDPIIDDYNDDGAINSEDLQVVGNALPDFTYGFTSTWRYKNIDLGVVFDGSYGASRIITAARNAALIRNQENTLRMFYDDRYREGEIGHHFGKAKVNVTGMRHWNQSYFVRDASYLRIRNITLGYNMPQALCSKIGINDVRLALSVQNAYTFTSYPLYNPQSNTHNGSSGVAQFGVDDGTYPLARVYSISLNFNF